MPEENCEQKVDRFLNGLVKAEHSRLMAIALRQLGNVPDAEDAVQDVYLKILRRFRDSEDEPRSSGLAINGIRWTAISELRRRASQAAALGLAVEIDSIALSHSDTPRHAAERNEVRARTAMILPPAQYEALEYYGSTDATSAEAGEVLGIPGYEVRRRNMQARSELGMSRLH